MTQTEHLNELLRKQNYSFRVLGPSPEVIGEGSAFVTRVFSGELGTVYIDSNLERYVRYYGKLYHCTNFDLMAMKAPEREAFLWTLAGELIF